MDVFGPVQALEGAAGQLVDVFWIQWVCLGETVGKSIHEPVFTYAIFIFALF